MGKRSKRSNTSTVVDADNSEDDVPSWDTSEAERGPWFYDLEEWLPGEDAEYETLIEEGTCTNHYKTAVVSADHAEIIKQGLMPPYTFTNPSPLVPVPSAPLAAPAPRAPPSTPAPAPAPASDPASSSGSTTAAPPTTIVTVPPSTPRPLSADDAILYSLAPQAIKKKDREMATDILSTITDGGTRRELKKQCNSSGRELLRIIYADLKATSEATAGAIEGQLLSWLKQGPVDASLTAWNKWRNKAKGYNLVLEGTSFHMADSIMASKFTVGIGRLSETHKQNLKVQIAVDGAKGNLPKVEKSIHTVLDEAEAEAKSARLDGLANAAHDPDKNRRSDTPFTWKEGMRPCSHCDGNHLDKECPDKAKDKSKSRKEKKERKEKRRAAKAIEKAAKAAKVD